MACDNYIHAGIFAIAILSVVGCTPVPDREHLLVSGPVHVSANQRFSIKSPNLLHTPNYWNSVCLLPDLPTQLSEVPNFGFVGASGKPFSPEVHVRNADGIEDSLPDSGDLGTEDGIWLCFQPKGDNVQLHSPYTEVVILSPEPISIKSIKWHSSDK